MEREVWVFAEKRIDQLARVTLELLSKGAELCQPLGGKLASVLIGDNVAGLAPELIAYGAAKVYLLEEPGLEFYQSEAYASVLADLIREHRPEIVLLGATSIGKDLAPRVAAKVATGLTAHCVDLKIEEHQGRPLLVQVVAGWSGSMMLRIICPQRRPQMATVKPGIFDLPAREAAREGQVIRASARLEGKHFRAKTVEVVEERPTGASLEESDVVVAGGWGLYSGGGFEPVKELAGVLNGAVGGTRPTVDKGWIPEEQMIGQSGKTVSPRLFLSLGASGAMHFTTGFLKSRFILAVDRNPESPIFQVADIGIVGDLQEVLPCLIEEFRAWRLERGL